MLLLMLEAGMPIDCVLTADTGMEFPEMYRHWDKIDQVLYQERGIHLTILRHPKGFEWLMFDQPKEKPKTLENRAKLGVPPYGNGWPGIRVRWCTGQLKTHLIAKEVNRLKKEKNALHYVGIAADEPARIKDEIYPLVEWGITEAQALKICAVITRSCGPDCVNWTGGQIIEKQIEAFNSTIGTEKGIHVTGVYQEWPGTNALSAAMTTDNTENMPDVVHMFSEYVGLIRDWDRTVWAEDFINAPDSSVSKDELIPNSVAAYSIGDRMIGVPFAISALLLYYNQDQLAQAGFDAPPETIAEMAEMLPALTAKAGADYGMNVRLDQFEFENFIVTQGPQGTYFGDNESGHAGQMTELACRDAIDAFLTEWEKVITSGAYKETKDSMNEEFAQGLNSMCIMSSARIPAIAGLVGDSFEWGVSAIPKVSASDVGGAYPSGSGLFMVNRGDDARIQASWEFVQYLISADAQAMWLDSCGYVPVNVKAEETEAYQTAVSAEPRLSVPFQILKSTPASVVSSFCPDNQTVNTVIQDSMLAFAGGSMTKEQTLDAIVDGISTAFADYFRANPIQG